MKIGKIHLEALIVWLLYTAINKAGLAFGVSRSPSEFQAYGVNILISVTFGVLFLYIFSHEDFFKFAKEIEHGNSKKTRKLSHYFLHYGKLVTCLALGIVSGSLIGALSIRFLMPGNKYKYYLVAISSALSVFVTLGIIRGVIPLRLPL